MKKPESTFINMLLALLVITGVSAISLAGVYSLTADAIEAARQAKIQKAIRMVIPEVAEIRTFKVMPPTGKDSLIFYEVYNEEEKWHGTAVQTYTDLGFSGRFTIMVGFTPEGEILNTSVLEHKETPGLGDKMDIKKSNFSVQFRGKNPASFKLKVKKDGGDVDAITAATITSRAFCDAVQRAYDTFIKYYKNEQPE